MDVVVQNGEHPSSAHANSGKSSYGGRNGDERLLENNDDPLADQNNHDVHSAESSNSPRLEQGEQKDDPPAESKSSSKISLLTKAASPDEAMEIDDSSSSLSIKEIDPDPDGPSDSCRDAKVSSDSSQVFNGLISDRETERTDSREKAVNGTSAVESEDHSGKGSGISHEETTEIRETVLNDAEEDSQHASDEFLGLSADSKPGDAESNNKPPDSTGTTEVGGRGEGVKNLSHDDVIAKRSGDGNNANADVIDDEDEEFDDEVIIEMGELSDEEGEEARIQLGDGGQWTGDGEGEGRDASNEGQGLGGQQHESSSISAPDDKSNDCSPQADGSNLATDDKSNAGEDNVVDGPPIVASCASTDFDAVKTEDSLLDAPGDDNREDSSSMDAKMADENLKVEMDIKMETDYLSNDDGARSNDAESNDSTVAKPKPDPEEESIDQKSSSASDKSPLSEPQVAADESTKLEGLCEPKLEVGTPEAASPKPKTLATASSVNPPPQPATDTVPGAGFNDTAPPVAKSLNTGCAKLDLLLATGAKQQEFIANLVNDLIADQREQSKNIGIADAIGDHLKAFIITVAGPQSSLDSVVSKLRESLGIPDQIIVPPSEVVTLMSINNSTHSLKTSTESDSENASSSAKKDSGAGAPGSNSPCFPCPVMTDILIGIGQNLVMEANSINMYEKVSKDLTTSVHKLKDTSRKCEDLALEEEEKKKSLSSSRSGAKRRKEESDDSSDQEEQETYESVRAQKTKLESNLTSLTNTKQMLKSNLGRLRTQNAPFKRKLSKCLKCEFKTESLAVMYHHLLYPHRKLNRLECGFCDVRMATFGDMADHYELLHQVPCYEYEPLPSKLACETCPRDDFTSKGALKVHARACAVAHPRHMNMAPLEEDLLHINRLFWGLNQIQLTRIQNRMFQARQRQQSASAGDGAPVGGAKVVTGKTQTPAIGDSNHSMLRRGGGNEAGGGAANYPKTPVLSAYSAMNPRGRPPKNPAARQAGKIPLPGMPGSPMNMAGGRGRLPVPIQPRLGNLPNSVAGGPSGINAALTAAGLHKGLTGASAAAALAEANKLAAAMYGGAAAAGGTSPGGSGVLSPAAAAVAAAMQQAAAAGQQQRAAALGGGPRQIGLARLQQPSHQAGGIGGSPQQQQLANAVAAAAAAGRAGSPSAGNVATHTYKGGRYGGGAANRIPYDPKAKPYHCEICDAVQIGFPQYAQHLQQAHGKSVSGDVNAPPPLSCSKCGNQRFHSYEGLERHLLARHNLVSQELLRKARNKQDGGKCKLCAKYYQSGLVQHCATVHKMPLCTADIVYTCDICKAKFTIYAQLEQHLATVHKKQNNSGQSSMTPSGSSGVGGSNPGASGLSGMGGRPNALAAAGSGPGANLPVAAAARFPRLTGPGLTNATAAGGMRPMMTSVQTKPMPGVPGRGAGRPPKFSPAQSMPTTGMMRPNAKVLNLLAGGRSIPPPLTRVGGGLGAQIPPGGGTSPASATAGGPNAHLAAAANRRSTQIQLQQQQQQQFAIRPRAPTNTPTNPVKTVTPRDTGMAPGKIRYNCTPCQLKFVSYGEVIEHWRHAHLKQVRVPVCRIEQCTPCLSKRGLEPQETDETEVLQENDEAPPAVDGTTSIDRNGADIPPDGTKTAGSIPQTYVLKRKASASSSLMSQIVSRDTNEQDDASAAPPAEKKSKMHVITLD